MIVTAYFDPKIQTVLLNGLLATIFLAIIYGLGYKFFRFGTFNERFIHEIPAYALKSFSWSRFFSESFRFLGIGIVLILPYVITAIIYSLLTK